jgi:hypothetical protein
LKVFEFKAGAHPPMASNMQIVLQQLTPSTLPSPSPPSSASSSASSASSSASASSGGACDWQVELTFNGTQQRVLSFKQWSEIIDKFATTDDQRKSECKPLNAASVPNHHW